MTEKSAILLVTHRALCIRLSTINAEKNQSEVWIQILFGLLPNAQLDFNCFKRFFNARLGGKKPLDCSYKHNSTDITQQEGNLSILSNYGREKANILIWKCSDLERGESHHCYQFRQRESNAVDIQQI